MATIAKKKGEDVWGEEGEARSVVMSFCLGLVFATGVALFIFFPPLSDLGLYLISMTIFHMWEYIYVAIYRSSELTSHSFMLDHSPAFHAALAACILEYFIELLFFPSLKGKSSVYMIGFVITMIGQGIRTLAMITAAHNFSHIIAEQKEKEHKLVQHGIYGIVRHPSYTGWYIWSVATQIILANPICIVGYSIVVWKFFNSRIAYEEKTLVSFFGEQYRSYQKKVPSGIPLVP
eukprot:TRINITY_DN778_c0_g1_i1.p1 TRINITY_DN778_c0_g1~~TRINITY_DN778_c0_g1_i1.p1  ORF type:complete len:241 (-),score=64.36 TRINITY_DN778_c0_g1_i1:85-786(-)